MILYHKVALSRVYKLKMVSGVTPAPLPMRCRPPTSRPMLCPSLQIFYTSIVGPHLRGSYS